MSLKLDQGILVYPGQAPTRDQLSALLGMGGPASEPAAPHNAGASDDADDDKLLTGVADRLDADDLAAIKADPEAKRRFVQRLRNQRELNKERQQQATEAQAEAAEQQRVERRNQLAALGTKIGKAEVSK